MTYFKIFKISLLLWPIFARAAVAVQPFAMNPASQSNLPSVFEAKWQKIAPHPRLFVDQARFSSLKTQKDPVSLQLLAMLRAETDQNLTAPPIVYPTTGFKFGAMREVQGRIISLAMMFRLTGEKRYFERARQELLQLAALPDWCPGHFLDVGEGALAAGIGFDWLYDELSPSDRDQIARGIVQNALLPSLEVKPNSGSWLDGDFNWNQVCNGGLSVGALAIAEREPELARQIIERAIKSVPKAGEVYAPSGAYPEGPSYWSYGTTFHVLLVEALRSALGDSFSLEKSPGFLQSAEWRLQMVAPSGGDYDYSDYHQENLNEPIMLWFARELGRRDLARTELEAIAARTAALTTTPPKKLNTNRHFPLELLWWQSDLPATQKDLPLHWTGETGHLPLAVLRSAWHDKTATYLAIKGGTPNQSHGHMDAGSFIFEARGVRWALDLGTESYGKMREAKLDLWNYTQDSSRWTTFRVGPEGHNLMRFNGERQNIAGHATIHRLPDEAGTIGDVAELSSLYPQVESATRTVKLRPDQSIAIEDRWKTGAKAVDYAFQWLTKAKVTASPDGLKLEQAGETLQLKIESPNAFQIAVEDVSQSKATQDSPNPGLSRIVIRQKTAANSDGFLALTTH